MEVWMLYIAALFLLRAGSRAEDTGNHQVERLARLLTLKECEDLVEALSSPEESIFTRLERLAPENNQLLSLSKRAMSTEDEAKCRAELTDWLLEYGEEVFYERLGSALQHVRRTDVVMEVVKQWGAVYAGFCIFCLVILILRRWRPMI